MLVDESSCAGLAFVCRPSMVWHGLVRRIVVWSIMVWYGIVGMVGYGRVCYGMLWLGTAGKVWHSMVWYSWYAGRVEGLPAEALQPLLLALNLHILYHIFLRTQFFDPNKNIWNKRQPGFSSRLVDNFLLPSFSEYRQYSKRIFEEEKQNISISCGKNKQSLRHTKDIWRRIAKHIYILCGKVQWTSKAVAVGLAEERLTDANRLKLSPCKR